jgi:hypothetical protein
MYTEIFVFARIYDGNLFFKMNDKRISELLQVYVNDKKLVSFP